MTSDVAAAARHDPVVDPDVVARATVGLLVGAALLAGLGAATATRPLAGSVAVVLVVAALTLSSAVVVVPALRRAQTYGLAAALATGCATVAVLSGVAGAAAAPIFYVPVAIYAAYFLTTPAVVVQTGVIVTAYASAIVGGELEAPVARGVVATVTVVTTAVLVRLIRDRVFTLIATLDRIARTDALTGALNRLGLIERLEEELERARRTGLPCAVLMADIDRFKALNDRLGHHQGDVALRFVVDAFNRRLRRLDWVGRLGGDEFVVVLSATGREAASRLLSDLDESLATDAPVSVPVRVSFGIAVHPDDGESVAELLASADKALLAKKASGTMPD